MAINIAVFVPEGMVVASDCLSVIKIKQDDGYRHVNANRTFDLFHKYIISFCGDGFLLGLPYGYYVTRFQQDNWNVSNQRPLEIAKIFVDYLKELFKITNCDCFYIAGYDKINNHNVPLIAYFDSDDFHVVNSDADNNHVYNFHAIGETYWIYKLLLNTKFAGSENTLEFGNINIDFSKYSLPDAIVFAKALLRITRQMDYICQFSEKVGEKLTIATLSPLKGVDIQELDR